MSINKRHEKNTPPDTEDCYETVASQEEICRDNRRRVTREFDLRPTIAEHLQISREKLELDWEQEITDDRCK
jgi:hypothetical protein